jgi:hypothetical protein
MKKTQLIKLEEIKKLSKTLTNVSEIAFNFEIACIMLDYLKTISKLKNLSIEDITYLVILEDFDKNINL